MDIKYCLRNSTNNNENQDSIIQTSPTSVIQFREVSILRTNSFVDLRMKTKEKDETEPQG